MWKGTFKRRWQAGIVCLICFGLFASPVEPAPAIKQIVIVKSSDNSYFNQTAEALISNVDQAITFKVMLERELQQLSPADSQQSLFVALGDSAVTAVNEISERQDSINAYLTLEQYRQLDLSKQTTVLLDQPLRRYLLFCKLILPVNSVGIMLEEQIVLNQQESRLLQQLEFEFTQYQIDKVNKLLPVLRKLLTSNDALLMLPRQAIYNRDTLKGVLLTSYRNRKPAISYSPAHVKSGALASIYSSPVDIGRHIAALVSQRLGNSATSLPSFEFAKFYSIATNSRVARALGVSLPSDNEIRSGLENN